jgi:septation ring formation regulator EzrA
MIEQALSIALGLVAFFGGIWVKRIAEDTNKLEKEVDEIRRHYQTREDGRRIETMIKEQLGDIKQQMIRIENKLDRKADKP